MITKWQLAIMNGRTLIYVKTFETKEQAVKHYETIKNKYPIDDYSVYYIPTKYYP